MGKPFCCTVTCSTSCKRPGVTSAETPVSESVPPCEDYYSMSIETAARSDPRSEPPSRRLSANTLHLQPTSEPHTRYQFRSSRRLFGLRARVLISSLTVYLLRRSPTAGHVWHKAAQGEQMFATPSPTGLRAGPVKIKKHSGDEEQERDYIWNLRTHNQDAVARCYENGIHGIYL